MSDTPKVPLSRQLTSAQKSITVPANKASGRDSRSLGVQSAFPFMSPKYVRHRDGRNHEFPETMARMFLKVPSDAYKSFLSSLEDSETRRIAKIIAGDEVSQGGVGYLDFLLQSVSHSLTEKVQIVETLSDNYVAYFFGQSAPVWQYSGTLMNTYQDDWTMRMFRIFRDMGRGSALARHGLVMRLKYDSMIVAGAMLNFNWQLMAGAETYTKFSFDFLVKGVQVIYGGLTRPTRLDKSQAFTPTGVQLSGSPVETGKARQTYVGTPADLPEGVTEGQLGYGTTESVDSPTGATYTNPEPFETELGLV